ncbi:MAG TPA: ATP-binding protein, partial [Chthoniobacteraceae bacterium]|nr:ATP-binding protein [Chthoniobacteraceae bacterium]
MLEASGMQQIENIPLVDFIAPDHREAFGLCMEALWRGEQGYAEFECIGRNGRRRWVEMHGAPLQEPGGRAIAFLGVLRDNTARRDLDKQFIQAQKMEVVGHLAGGVAHDFNNMLGIVMGYTEMMMDGMTPGSPEHRHAQTVFHTAERAAALTRQLLIFSRKQTPRPQPVHLSELIMSIDPMLRRLIGENVRLQTVPEPDLDLVEADPCQIEQVVMNLVINARDAMPGGGAIAIATGVTTLAQGALPGLPAGRYVTLAVKDTGAGMPEELLGKIFEAFFTTKPEGQGTGLGLATCQSIMRQWHGHLAVESRLGAGSTFTAYFPASAAPPRQHEAGSGEASPVPRGHETILVVEDEPGLLELAAFVLQRHGYTVLKAANGRVALGIVNERTEDEISLVVTDMVMPEMGGKLMAEWLRAIRPRLKVLFTTGYTEATRDCVPTPGMSFLPKPYTPSALLRKVREVIDRPAVESLSEGQ